MIDDTLVVTKEAAPDTTVQIFWVKNRKTYEWIDKKDLDMKAEINKEDPFSKMMKEDGKNAHDDCADALTGIEEK